MSKSLKELTQDKTLLDLYALLVDIKSGVVSKEDLFLGAICPESQDKTSPEVYYLVSTKEKDIRFKVYFEN